MFGLFESADDRNVDGARNTFNQCAPFDPYSPANLRTDLNATAKRIDQKFDEATHIVLGGERFPIKEILRLILGELGKAPLKTPAVDSKVILGDEIPF